VTRLSASICALLILILTACSTTPEAPKEIPPRPPRDTVRNFSINARAIINQAGKANTIRIMWEHSPANDAIGFASPLTGMIAELQRDQSGASWTTSNGERYDARNADMLIARITDAPVPISSLALWITGRTSEGSTEVQMDSKGRLIQAVDKGWLVRILNYETDLPNAMPSVMEAESGSLRIRLAFEEYVI